MGWPDYQTYVANIGLAVHCKSDHFWIRCNFHAASASASLPPLPLDRPWFGSMIAIECPLPQTGKVEFALAAKFWKPPFVSNAAPARSP